MRDVGPLRSPPSAPVRDTHLREYPFVAPKDRENPSTRPSAAPFPTRATARRAFASHTKCVIRGRVIRQRVGRSRRVTCDTSLGSGPHTQRQRTRRTRRACVTRVAPARIVKNAAATRRGRPHPSYPQADSAYFERRHSTRSTTACVALSVSASSLSSSSSPRPQCQGAGALPARKADSLQKRARHGHLGGRGFQREEGGELLEGDRVVARR